MVGASGREVGKVVITRSKSVVGVRNLRASKGDRNAVLSANLTVPMVLVEIWQPNGLTGKALSRNRAAAFL